MTKTHVRCPWSEGVSDAYMAYHDAEWGVPAYDDKNQFEFLILEGAQAGLSWSTILHRREGYRKAFANFDVQKVARFTDARLLQLQKDEGIVRNKLKIQSVITNAQHFIAIQEEFGSFSDYIWGFVDGVPIQNVWTKQEQVPATNAVSDALSKDMKQRGFKFVGSVILYAHMQATGLVNDHLESCFRNKTCEALAGANSIED
ncbi:MAG: DNA-3-methyladenine glycosylase I [Gammaproteobacteria bacterium]|nr:DNA-3-methyladenine glycosylase I [Gammaproteobacteria bacterium]